METLHCQPPIASGFRSFHLAHLPRATSSKNPLLNFPLNLSCTSPTAECLIVLCNYFLCELFCLPGLGREDHSFDTFYIPHSVGTEVSTYRLLNKSVLSEGATQSVVAPDLPESANGAAVS